MTEEEILLEETDCLTFADVDDLVSSISDAVAAEELLTLGSVADKWKSLISNDSLPSDLWAELILADPLARAVRIKKRLAIDFLITKKGLRLEQPCAESCSCRLCIALSNDLRFLQLYSEQILVPLTSLDYVRLAFTDDPIRGCLQVWRAIRESSHYRCIGVLSLKDDLHRRLEKTILTCFGTTVSEDEVIALLGAPSPFTRINSIVRARMQRAVAHPAVQGLLMRGWRNGKNSIPCLEGRLPTVLRPIVHLFVYLILVPICIVFPHSKLLRYIRCPETVYTNEAVAYWIFLLLVTSSFFQPGISADYIICRGSTMFHHYFLAIIILARFLKTCNGLRHFGTEFFTSGYEVLQCLSGIFYAIGMMLMTLATHVVPLKPEVRRVCTDLAFHLATDKNISRATAMMMMLSRKVTQCQAIEDFYSMGPEYVTFVNTAIEPHNLSSFFFAIGHLLYYLSAGQVLYMNKLVGHLNIAVTKMIGDVVRWALVMFLFFIAWTLAMVSLYKNYSCENSIFGTMKASLLEMFWVLFAMTGMDDYVMSGRLAKLDHKSVALVEYAGLFIYASYYILAQIVLVNLLIALMSVTFQNIEDDKQTSLAYWRSKIQVKFIRWHSVASLPTPFNLAYPILWLTKGAWEYFSGKNIETQETELFIFDLNKQKRHIRRMFSRKLFERRLSVEKPIH